MTDGDAASDRRQGWALQPPEHLPASCFKNYFAWLVLQNNLASVNLHDVSYLMERLPPAARLESGLLEANDRRVFSAAGMSGIGKSTAARLFKPARQDLRERNAGLPFALGQFVRIHSFGDNAKYVLEPPAPPDLHPDLALSRGGTDVSAVKLNVLNRPGVHRT